MLFFPPHQAVVQGTDATVYANWGRKVAETGGLMFDDPFVASMPADARAEWFENRSQFQRTGRLHRFPGGFQIAGAPDPTVTASFAPMFAILGALLHQLSVGELGSLYVAPLFGMLSVVGLFFVATHLGGRRVGWLTAALTLAAMPQLWFARMPMPEMVAQCFVMTGLLAWLAALRDQKPAYAVAAGFFFGMAGFAKVDLNVLLPVAFVMFGAWRYLGGTPRRSFLPWMLVAFVPLLAHNVVHYLIVPSDYIAAVENLIRRSELGVFATSITIGVSLVLYALAVAAWHSPAWVRHRATGVALAMGAAAYFYNYFTTIQMSLDETVVPLSWYISWAVILIGAGSVVWLIASGRARRDEGIGLVLALLAVFGLTYFYSLLEPVVHIFSMRRYVPVVLPLLMLVAALGIDAVVRRSAPWFRVWVTASAGLILVSLVVRPSLAVINTPFWTGALSQTASVARMFPPDAVLLMSPELDSTHLPTTLGYLYDVDTVLVQDRHPRSELIEDSVSDWLRGGRQVFFVFGRDGFSMFAPTLRLGEVREALIEVPILESTRGRRPQASITQSIRLQVYPVWPRVVAAEVVDVGEPEDVLYDLRGFYGPERTSEGGTFRWTGPEASLRVPASTEVTLTLGGARPAGVSPAEVTVWIAGCEMLATPLPDMPEDISVTVPPTSEPSVEVMIRATAFNPAARGLVPPDLRDLGVRVYRVAFAGEPEPVEGAARWDDCR